MELTVTSEPVGASVQLEGQPLGATPLKLPLTADAPPVLVTEKPPPGIKTGR